MVDELAGNMGVLTKLQDFNYKDKNGKDWGLNVRHRAKELGGLVSDPDRVRTERNKVCPLGWLSISRHLLQQSRQGKLLDRCLRASAAADGGACRSLGTPKLAGLGMTLQAVCRTCTLLCPAVHLSTAPDVRAGQEQQGEVHRRVLRRLAIRGQHQEDRLWVHVGQLWDGCRQGQPCGHEQPEGGQLQLPACGRA